MSGEREERTDNADLACCADGCDAYGRLSEDELIRFSEEAGQKLIRQGGTVDLESESTLYVHWRITNYCNFKCSYCFAPCENDITKSLMPSMDLIENAVKNLSAANRQHYRVILLGGEPTAHPQLLETILTLYSGLGKRLEYVRIITNGSISSQKMSALANIGRFLDIHFCVSVHVEYTTVKHVTMLVQKLSGSVRLQFKIMLQPDLFDKVKSIVDALIALRSEYAFSMDIGILRRPPDYVHDDDRYTDEHYAYAKEAFRRFMQAARDGVQRSGARSNVQRNTNARYYLERNVGGSIEYRDDVSKAQLRDLTDSYVFKNMICCAGVNVLDVFANGACRGLVCGWNKTPANLYKYDPFLVRDMIRGIKCGVERCGCSANHNVPKFLLPKEGAAFIEARRSRQTELTEEWIAKHGKADR
ncbi:MAG: radical SAM protein [Clostridia bacterium]|nr:radical SAM protein [Clostridia bacterium]